MWGCGFGPRGPPLGCVAARGHHHGASTPTHPPGVDPVSNPACEIFPTTALHAPCWFTLNEGPQPGSGGEQSKHTPGRSQESLGGKCRAIYCCQGTCCLLGARSSSPDAPQRCKRVFPNFPLQPLGSRALDARVPDPRVASLLPAPSVSALFLSYPAPLTCLHGGISVGARGLHCSRPRAWVRPSRLTVPARVSWCLLHDRLIIDRLVCPRLCQHVTPSHPGACNPFCILPARAS